MDAEAEDGEGFCESRPSRPPSPLEPPLPALALLEDCSHGCWESCGDSEDLPPPEPCPLRVPPDDEPLSEWPCESDTGRTRSNHRAIEWAQELGFCFKPQEGRAYDGDQELPPYSCVCPSFLPSPRSSTDRGSPALNRARTVRSLVRPCPGRSAGGTGNTDPGAYHSCPLSRHPITLPGRHGSRPQGDRTFTPCLDAVTL